MSTSNYYYHTFIYKTNECRFRIVLSEVSLIFKQKVLRQKTCKEQKVSKEACKNVRG